jgi:2'-hydroxyisoflavone reductase
VKILIIGGTKFLGRRLVEAAQARNHDVTIFHRGKHKLDNLENVEEIFGDRNDDLDKLKNRSWDVCVDTCGYLPQTVRASAERLKDSVAQYVFISSISAYADFTNADYDESAPLAVLTDEQRIKAEKIDARGEITAVVLEDMYGALKAECERAAQNAFGDKTLIVRSGLIVGAYDTTDRFTYWAMRVAAGDEVLAPGSPNRFVQFIDARDLAEWIVSMIENKENGVYNATGRPFDLTMEKMLAEIKSVSQSDARFVWASEEFLEREQVQAWSEMPLYLPESAAELRGFLAANIDKALTKNLSFRSLQDTIEDTLRWRQTKKEEMKAGISREREKELLRKRRKEN